MSEIDELRCQLEVLRNWPVGKGSAPFELGQKLMDIAELNLRIADLLLKAATSSKDD